MKYIKFYLSGYYCETNTCFIEKFKDTVSNYEIQEYFEEYEQRHAESYEYLINNEGLSSEEYYENCFERSYWEEVTEEEYRGFLL